MQVLEDEGQHSAAKAPIRDSQYRALWCGEPIKALRAAREQRVAKANGWLSAKHEDQARLAGGALVEAEEDEREAWRGSVPVAFTIK